MKRNTALFGASLVAGLAAASGLIATSTTSSAAAGDTFYGVNWTDGTSGQTSGGWKTGAYADPYGFEFAGTATAGTGTFTLTAVPGSATVSVATTCVDGAPSVTVSGGGAAGTYTGGSVSLAKFVNASDAQGTVTFATQSVGGHAVGAYINLSPGLDGTWVALTGADCATATSTPPTSTTSSSSSSTTTPPPTSSTTNPPTSSTTPPPSTTTPPPSSSTTAPPTTPPPTTEPPTPTPTTTTLPVTG